MKSKIFKVFIFLILVVSVGVCIPNRKIILVDSKNYNNPNELENIIEVGTVQNGMFSVTIKNVNSKINNIEVPVWVKKDQSDLVWYKATKQSDGSYKANVYLKNHYMETGVYHIHVYFKHNNDFINLKSTSKIVNQISNGNLQINKINNDSQVLITLSNSDYQYNSIKFAVWSEANGQDDLIWYDASKVRNTSTYTIPIKNHKTFGKYHVHIYAYDNKGRGKIISNGGFNINSPQVEFSSFDYNPNTDAMDIKIKLNTSINITKIQVPTWSEANGQDDIVWYDAKKGSDGIWTVHTNLSKHHYFTGKYHAHFYVNTNTGIFSIVHSLIKEIVPNSRVKASVNSDKSGFTIDYRDYSKFKGYNIKYAVWSEANGQDDLVWYDAKNGKASGIFSNHLNRNNAADKGKYIVHFYVFKNGVPYIVDSTSFLVDAPKITYVETKQVGENIEVYIRNVSSNVKSIEIPTWSLAKGQDDIVWYKPTNLGGGTWKLVIKLKNHRYVDGSYAIHTYLKYPNRTQLIGSGCKVSINKGSVSASVNSNETTVRVTLSNSMFNKQNIRFAVWSDANGQDDLYWYNGKASANNSYYDIPIKNHKTSGRYNVHVYSDYGILTATSFNISSFDFNANISDIDKEDIMGDGIYKVTISGITSKSGIDKVEVPVWTTSNKNDIYTYLAKKEGNNYVVYVNPSHHKYNSGKYHTKVSVVGKNGVRVSKVSKDVEIKLKINAKVISSNRGNTTIRVYNTAPNVKKVQLPTWSVTNWQDDLYWYDGKKQGDGSYIVVVKSSNHSPFDANSQASLISHLYVNDKLENSLSYTVSKYLLVPKSYSQKDGRWSGFVYGFKNLATSGCMPTAIAMVLSGILERNIYPNEIADYLYYNTNQFNRLFLGAGGLAVYYAAQHYGVSYKSLNTYAKLKSALENGQLVIGAVRNGSLNFVKPGYTHAIVMYGYDSKTDKTNVIDPLGFAKNGKYKVREIANQPSQVSEDLNAGGPFHAVY